MRSLELIETPLIVVRGMSEAEIEELWVQHCLRARMTQEFLDKNIDAETFLDFLAEQNYDPGEVLDTAEENLNWAIKSGTTVEG